MLLYSKFECSEEISLKAAFLARARHRAGACLSVCLILLCDPDRLLIQFSLIAPVRRNRCHALAVHEFHHTLRNVLRFVNACEYLVFVPSLFIGLLPCLCNGLINSCCMASSCARCCSAACAAAARWEAMRPLAIA